MEQQKHMIFDVDTRGKQGTNIGLNPLKSRIMLIGVKSIDFEKVISYSNEKKILEEFWELVRKEGCILVGFNCSRFDVPFLYKRSLLNNVRVVNLKNRCIDLRLLLNNGNSKVEGTLDNYGKLLDYNFSRSGFSKSNLSILWQGHNIPELKDKLLEDVRLTYALFERARGVGLV